MRSKLQSQQILLAFLGFYSGKCDGIWGQGTVAAMRKYESEPIFNPGYPSHGMPFKERGQLPTGVYRVPGKPGVLSHVDMPADFASKKMAELVTEEKSRALLNPNLQLKSTSLTTSAVPVETKVEAEVVVDTESKVEPVTTQDLKYSKPFNKHSR